MMKGVNRTRSPGLKLCMTISGDVADTDKARRTLARGRAVSDQVARGSGSNIGVLPWSS